jgi:hypothetical protein
VKKFQTSNTLVGSTKIRIVARVVEGVTNGWFGLGGQLVCKTNGARSIRAPPSLKFNSISSFSSFRDIYYYEMDERIRRKIKISY